MILKELYELYNRLLEQGEDVPKEGEWKQDVGLVIVLTNEGKLSNNKPVRYIGEPDKKGKYGTVPLNVYARSKTNSVEPGFLCDKLENILGIPAKPAGKDPNKQTQAEKYRDVIPAKYSKLLLDFDVLENTGVAAVARFIREWDSENVDSLGIKREDFILNVVFKIEGRECYVHEEPEVQKWWIECGYSWWYPKGKATISQCLVTGKNEEIAHTHIPRLTRIGSKPASLVSYNVDSFESYGKKQGVNAPVAARVASSYCNALDYLLRRDISRIQLADMTMVFWTDAKTKEEDDLSVWLVGSAIEPEYVEHIPAQNSSLIKSVGDDLKRISQGKPIRSSLDFDTRFFVLGLSPNEGRIVVQCFYESSYGEFINKLCDHYAFMNIIPSSKKKETLVVTPYMILQSCTRIKEEDKDIFDVIKNHGLITKLKKEIQQNVPAHHASVLMQSVLSGTSYPDFIASAIMNRIKTESCTSQLKKHPGYYQIRCAFLKAWLSRRNSSYSIKTMLDPNNKEIGYVLGRLLSVFQKVQDDAYPNGLNRTIMDSFYASASSAPMSVFSRIIKLNHYHMTKLGIDKPGLQIKRRKQIEEIFNLIAGFPAHLNLEQQGLFALGFYHQTQDFYRSNKEVNQE